MQINQLHDWNLSIDAAKKIQEELKLKIITSDETDFRQIKRIAAADISFNFYSNLLFGVVVIFDFDTITPIIHYSGFQQTTFPYVPGYLSFREAPLILDICKNITEKIDLFICDGQGIAHPRGIGLASHIGLFLDTPTIGCAKSLLCGEVQEPAPEKGSTSPIIFNGEEIGLALRSRQNVKPVYISSGHRISSQLAKEIIIYLSPRYRIAEPLRAAHKLVNQYRKEYYLTHS